MKTFNNLLNFTGNRWCFQAQILLVLTIFKAAFVIIKGYPNTACSYMNGFLKAGGHCVMKA
jgi:hypothetical protein